MSVYHFVYILISVSLSVGVYGVLTSPNLMKKIISLGVIQTSIIMLYVLIGFKSGGFSPVYREGVSNYVNPLPQVLMLTAIVVGLAVSSIGYALILKIHKLFGTLNSHSIDEKCSYDVSYKEILRFQEDYKFHKEAKRIQKEKAAERLMLKLKNKKK